MLPAGAVCVVEDVCSEQSVKQHHVHGGDETQADRPHRQDVSRHMFTVSCQPASHPSRRTDAKHQQPADETENQRDDFSPT